MDYKTVVPEVNAILNQYNVRMTLRQIFYRLVSKHLIQNTLSQYKNLSRILVKARERGDVDWTRIEDRSRTTIGGDYGFNSAEHFLGGVEENFKQAWKRFTMPMWASQPNFLEVWVEKDALSALVSDVAEGFRVKTCPARGYSSFTYVKEGAERLDEYEDKENIIILYLGDYDPSGLDITRDLEERLQDYGILDVDVERIALTLDQIRQYSLPPMMAKQKDPRYAKFVADTGGADAVELDALEPPILQDIITRAIQSKIDTDLWNERAKEIEETRERLREKFEKARIEWEQNRQT